MSTATQTTTNWPELAIGLYDRLTDRCAEITYQFNDMSVQVPGSTGDSPRANWKLNGALTIRTVSRNGNGISPRI